MKQPHVHAEVIKAWAEGVKVQFKRRYNDEWTDVGNHTPLFSPDHDYRIKPEEKYHEGKYRVGLWEYSDGTIEVIAETENNLVNEKSKFFKGWLTDWITYKVKAE